MPTAADGEDLLSRGVPLKALEPLGAVAAERNRHAQRLSRARFHTVAVCFVAQNLAMGIGFGSFGPLLAANEHHFNIGRTAASSGISLVTLAMSLLSPLAGWLLQRVPVRGAMVVGAALSCVGYAGLAVTSELAVALVFYALIGTGISLAAVLGPLTLVGRWVHRGRGRILGIVNLPLVMFICPFVVAKLLPLIGRFDVLIGISALFALLLPLLILIGERPPASRPKGVTCRATASSVRGKNIDVVRLPSFWLLSLGIGVLAGSGTVFVVHIVPYGVDHHMSLQAASVLLSIYAGSGIVGTLVFGSIADRVSPMFALMLSGALQSVFWLALVYDVGPFGLNAAVLGCCCMPLVTLHGATMTALYGAEAASKAVGLSYLVKLPFLFGFAPGAAMLFSFSGSYRLPFLCCALLVAIAVLLFWAISWAGRRQPLRAP